MDPLKARKDDTALRISAVNPAKAGVALAEVLRPVVRRAMVLLELGEFVRGARPNVQAEIAVDVLQLDRVPVRASEVARIDVPDHAATRARSRSRRSSAPVAATQH